MGEARKHLAVVDVDTGEVTDECPGCAILKDQIKGYETDLRSWRTRYANLARDKQAEAEADPIWPLAVRLFAYWKRRSGHGRAEWTTTRFEMVRKLLDKPDGLERSLRAISGCLSDQWRRERHLDLWEDIFESQKKLERCLAMCPKNWQPPPGYEKAPPTTKG